MTPTERYNLLFVTPAPTLKEQLETNMANYIIWNPASRLPPTVTHDSRPTAIKVAGRMAGQNPGESFYVCKLVQKAFKARPVPQPEPTVVYEDLEKDPPESCPF